MCSAGTAAYERFIVTVQAAYIPKFSRRSGPFKNDLIQPRDILQATHTHKKKKTPDESRFSPDCANSANTQRHQLSKPALPHSS